MSHYTVRAIEEMEEIHHGVVKLAGAELGVRAFGMQVLDLPGGFSEYPEHDHADDGQEEVYLVLAGSTVCQIDGEAVRLGAGQMIRVEPGARRKLLPGAEGARVLALGAAPDRRYERPEAFRIGVGSC
ncbi:MAG TPA: cupin domain-containing protein [Solirubrobacteraceae bacterium]|nr:cupin domain-containing protein [Solirubrobacteraceae bacterium]